jgi:hypothetical protein
MCTRFVNIPPFFTVAETATMQKIGCNQLFVVTKPDGVRRIGRPRLRWEDGVDQDMRTLEVKNWKKVALDRVEWAKLLKKARAHQGLSNQ